MYGNYTPEIEQSGIHSHLASDESFGTCFPKNTKINFYDGTYKNIEDIKQDDYIISGSGKKRKVTHIFKRKYNDDLYTFNLKYRNQFPLKCTKEHPIYIGEHDRFSNGCVKGVKDIG